MRILHIGKYYWPIPGGIETAVRDIAVEQVRQGHSVWVLSHWQRPGLVAQQESHQEVQVCRVPIVGHVAYAPIAPSFPRVFRRVMSDARPDVIHVHMPNLSPLWLGVWTLQAPLVVHWHSDVYTSLKSLALALLYPGYAVFQKRLLSKAAAVIATSDSYRQASKPLQSFDDKTVTIPLALDPDRMCAVHNAQSVDGTRPFVFSAGRFTYYKGFDVLIRAAAHLRGDVKVTIAGSGPLHDRMRSLVDKMGLQSRIELPGRLEDKDLHALMAQCSVFCLPSIDRTEAFGLVLLEAMHYARPVVSTRVRGSGMQLVNEHKVTGLCVEPEDDLALARALNSLLLDPDLAQGMGNEGKKRTETRFHISRQVMEISRLYASLA